MADEIKVVEDKVEAVVVAEAPKIEAVVTEVQNEAVSKSVSTILVLHAALKAKEQELVALAAKDAAAVKLVASTYIKNAANSIESQLAQEKMKLATLDKSVVTAIESHLASAEAKVAALEAKVKAEATGFWAGVKTFFKNLKTLFSKEL